mgnify:CR=1 FL=1
MLHTIVYILYTIYTLHVNCHKYRTVNTFDAQLTWNIRNFEICQLCTLNFLFLFEFLLYLPLAV